MERLQKYMAHCGIASRRKCEEIILEGRVSVNSKAISELGYKVSVGDEVRLDGELILPEANKVYIALYKPTGYISTVKDERGRKTILDLIDIKERIYPVGRLDYDTSGLILLTNDGDIYNKIIHPREEKEKVYIALINGLPSKVEINNFNNGLDIDGYVTAPAQMKIIETNENNSEVIITIHEGKNRQIRKMCEKINHDVIELKRISVGKIYLDDLEEGKWRYLVQDEISYLKNEI